MNLKSAVVHYLPSWLTGSLFGVEVWQYLVLLLVFLTGLIIRKIIQVVVASRVRHLVEHLGQAWAIHFVNVFASPGAMLSMALLARITYPELGLPKPAARVMQLSVRILIVLSIVWATYRFVDLISARMAERAAKTESKLDDQLVPLVRKSLKIFTVVAGVLIILQNLDVNVASLLAGLGIGGVAVALAAKDTVANFFGSVMIFADRPFQIGDVVSINSVEGIVEEVGFRSTRIRTFYNSLVTVPNARFTEAAIDNYGARRYRRQKFTLNLTYDTTPEQMQAFVEGVRAIIAANPVARKDAYEVHMSDFGASSLDVLVYFFFETNSWSVELRERHNVLIEIMRLARDVGVDFAFPTQTLFVPELAQPGAERKLPAPPSEQQLGEVVHGFAPGGKRSRPGGPHITDGYFAVPAPPPSQDEN